MKRILAATRITDGYETISHSIGRNPQTGQCLSDRLAWIVGRARSRAWERYIRPRENWFAFTWLHGITADHVREAPEFPDVRRSSATSSMARWCSRTMPGRCRPMMQGCRPRLSVKQTQNALSLHARHARASAAAESKRLNAVAAHLA